MTKPQQANRPLAFSVAAFALATLACAFGGSRASGTNLELSVNTLTHDWLERIYYLLEPSTLKDRAPLVLSLHGGGGNGQQTCSMEGGIQELAEREGFLVACPEGIENHWNDGRANERYRAHIEDIDDVGFLINLIWELKKSHNIDTNRVLITGASNGGMMSLRMACEASHMITAVGAVIASLPAALHCTPTGPVSVLMMNGLDDPLVPYEGGQVRFLRQELGEVISTGKSFGLFVNKSRCNGPPQVDWLPDRDPNDGTRTFSETFSDCQADVLLTMYSVQGGGHTMPGGTQYMPKYLIGRVSRDFSGAEAIWEFFENAP